MGTEVCRRVCYVLNAVLNIPDIGSTGSKETIPDKAYMIARCIKERMEQGKKDPAAEEVSSDPEPK